MNGTARPALLAALAHGALSRPWPAAALAGSLLASLAGALAAPALMLLAPLAILAGGALVALLVLALGARAAAPLAAGGALAIALGMAAGIPPAAAAVVVLVHGAVVAGLAAILRRSGALALALSAAGAAALGAAVLDSPAQQAARRALLSEWTTQALGSTPAELGAALELALRLGGGLLGLSLLAGWAGALCAGRSLQARARAPGAFADEFRALRFGRALSAVVVALAAAALLEGLGGRALAAQLALVGGGLGALQGLSVLHALVAARALWPATLWLAYAALVLATAHALLLGAALGLVDNWFDFRARAARRAGTVE